MARILLIDDDADLVRSLKTALEDRGYQVETLEAPHRGPELLTPGRFDLVLLDNRMPGISGIEIRPLAGPGIPPKSGWAV